MRDLPAITQVALRWHLLAVAALCAVASALQQGAWLSGLLAGGAIGAANLWALGWIGRKLLGGDPSAKMRAALLLALKLGVVGAVVLAALVLLKPQPMALLVAFTAAPAALMVAARAAMNAPSAAGAEPTSRPAAAPGAAPIP